MLLLSAGSRATRAPVPASRRGVFTSGLVRGPPRLRKPASLGNGDRGSRSPFERVSLGAAAAFARGRAERGTVATRAADEPPDAKAAEPARESHFANKDLFDVSVRKKKKKKSDDDDDDDEKKKTSMSDVEATRALETVLGVHMNESAARVIARDFAALGVDTPAKLRRMIVGKSFRLILTQALAVLVNAVVALSMFLLLKNSDAIFSGAFDVAAMNDGWFIVFPKEVGAVVRSIVEVLAFGVGGAFAVESFAHVVIFGTFVANAFFFGFTDLHAFVDAVQTLSGEKNREKRKMALASLPGVTGTARDAAFAVDATRRLASLRACVDEAVRKTPETANMSGVQRLGALLELSVAETVYDFRPSDFALSESEAMRVASLFARFDDDADGFVSRAEVAALLRSAADSASAEVLDAMAWDPYAATFASDDDENDPGALAMAVLDADDDGRVSLEEFVAWWRGGCPLEPGESETGMPYDSAAAGGNADATHLTDRRGVLLARSFWVKGLDALGREAVGVALFRNVFDAAPEALALFGSFKDEPDLYSSDRLKAHGVKVVDAVSFALDALAENADADDEKLRTTLRELGAKHVGYGVTPAQYDVVGAALLKTLAEIAERVDGDAFAGSETETAWRAVWAVVASLMIDENHVEIEAEKETAAGSFVSAEDQDARTIATQSAFSAGD